MRYYFMRQFLNADGSISICPAESIEIDEDRRISIIANQLFEAAELEYLGDLNDGRIYAGVVFSRVVVSPATSGVNGDAGSYAMTVYYCDDGTYEDVDYGNEGLLILRIIEALENGAEKFEVFSSRTGTMPINDIQDISAIKLEAYAFGIDTAQSLPVI